MTPKQGRCLQQIPGRTSEFSFQENTVLGTAKILWDKNAEASRPLCLRAQAGRQIFLYVLKVTLSNKKTLYGVKLEDKICFHYANYGKVKRKWEHTHTLTHSCSYILITGHLCNELILTAHTPFHSLKETLTHSSINHKWRHFHFH